MKKYRILLAVAMLVFTLLACQALSGGGSAPSVAPSPPDSGNANQPDENSNGAAPISNFPMADDAFNVIDVGDGSVLYYTKMSGEDVMNFYRDAYTSRGYTENETLTTISSSVFNLVFDGGPDDRAVVIQSVDLGDGSRTITIRLEAK